LKLAVLVTAFPQKAEFSYDFFDSLSKQTNQSFDVVLVNDGVKDLASILAQFKSLNVIELECGDTLSENRSLMINYALSHGYEKAIFGDFDDYFSSNRVQLCSELLYSYDVVVNDVSLVCNGKVIKDSFFLSELGDQQEFSLDDILEKNFVGMSNAAIKLDNLAEVSFPENLRVVDWHFFSLLLMKSKRCLFTSQAITYYRQHERNIANIGQISREQFENEIAIKLTHYKLLKEYDKRFEKLYREVLSVEESLSNENMSSIASQFCDFKASPFWWSIFSSYRYRQIENEI